MTIYRRAWTMQLRAGAEAAYDAAHAQIWPELADQMIADGVLRFHLFRSGMTVFAVQERLSPFPGIDARPSDLTARWWQDMAPLMMTDSQGRPHRTILKEVFALEQGNAGKETSE